MVIGFFDDTRRRRVYLVVAVIYVMVILAFSFTPISYETITLGQNLKFGGGEGNYLQSSGYFEYLSDFNYPFYISTSDYQSLEFDYTLQLSFIVGEQSRSGFEEYDRAVYDINLIDNTQGFSLRGVFPDLPQRIDTFYLQFSLLSSNPELPEDIWIYVQVTAPYGIYITDYPGMIILSMLSILSIPKFYERYMQGAARRSLQRKLAQRQTMPDPRAVMSGMYHPDNSRKEKARTRQQAKAETQAIQDRAVRDTDGGSKVA